jgi:hypothetical protein
METFGTCDNRLNFKNEQLQGTRGELKSTLLPVTNPASNPFSARKVTYPNQPIQTPFSAILEPSQKIVTTTLKTVES